MALLGRGAVSITNYKYKYKYKYKYTLFKELKLESRWFRGPPREKRSFYFPGCAVLINYVAASPP